MVAIMVIAIAVYNPHRPRRKAKGMRPLRKKDLLVLENSGMLVILRQTTIVFQRKLNEPQKGIAHGTGS